MAENKNLKTPIFPQRIISMLADEIARTVVKRLPHVLPSPRKKKPQKKQLPIDHPLFLDTSAIIDGRIFDVISLGLLTGTVVLLDSILSELKHIADSQDTVRRERGRKGLSHLDVLRKSRAIRMKILPDAEKNGKVLEVDEKLIHMTKQYKGVLITCDYNLEKKASIQGLKAVNMNALANALKIVAVPGEALHVKVQHHGKDITQGVAYLDDGTMIVVEAGSQDTGKEVDVVVSRVIQTASGRILFAKKI